MAKASDKLKSLQNVMPRDVKLFDPATHVPKSAPAIMFFDHQMLKAAEATLAELQQKIIDIQISNLQKADQISTDTFDLEQVMLKEQDGKLLFDHQRLKLIQQQIEALEQTLESLAR